MRADLNLHGSQGGAGNGSASIKCSGMERKPVRKYSRSGPACIRAGISAPVCVFSSVSVFYVQNFHADHSRCPGRRYGALPRHHPHRTRRKEGSRVPQGAHRQGRRHSRPSQRGEGTSLCLHSPPRSASRERGRNAHRQRRGGPEHRLFRHQGRPHQLPFHRARSASRGRAFSLRGQLLRRNSPRHAAHHAGGAEGPGRGRHARHSPAHRRREDSAHGRAGHLTRS